MSQYSIGQSMFGLKLVEIESKILALEDCMTALKMNESLSLADGMKIMRKLSNKQFKLKIKKDKVLRYIAMNQH